MHSKSNLIIGIAGYYTSSNLTLRKGDTFIIKGPFTFWNSPIWDFGGKDVYWQLFFFWGGGGGKMKPGLQISLQTLIINVMVWKIETGVLAFWGLSFQHKGVLGVLIIVSIEKSLFTSFFFALSVNYAYYHSRYDQGNETKSTTKLSNFHFQWTKTLYSNISTLWTFEPDKLNSLR